MRYMPIFIDLEAKPVLVVGAGPVALRRARQLLDAGARVTVIAPTFVAEFRELAGVELIERPVQIDDVLADYRLVIVATDNQDVNAMISDECAELGILCNRCDSFAEGSFVCGNVLRRGPVTCATMAGGVPEIARYLNRKIDGLISPALVELASLLVELRPAIKTSRPGQTRDFIAGLVNDETIARIELEGIDKLREEIMACL
ncbi:MAG: bifunctional precorrin-2 dehydrogenase/sirohydrochlorin ferrochelatase [Candidatus Riflebacteria bacterium]|nr:bifunctional precorrin-2 dehydrogenase/sirohydrochlorin ferrochelatase [Candidatus Riflebacteria bacterium]